MKEKKARVGKNEYWKYGNIRWIGLILSLIVFGCSKSDGIIQELHTSIDHYLHNQSEGEDSDSLYLTGLDSIFHLSLTIQYNDGIANSGAKIMRYYQVNDLQDYSQAFVTANNQLFEKLSNRVIYPKFLYQLGSVHFNYSNFSEASKYLWLASQAAVNQQDTLVEAKSLSLIGKIYGILEDKEKCIEYLEKGFALHKEIEYKLGIAKGYHNLSRTMEKKVEYEKIESYLLKSLAISNEIDNIDGVLINVVELKNLYQEIDDKGKLAQLIESNSDISTRFKMEELNLNSKCFVSEMLIDSGLNVEKGLELAWEIIGNENVRAFRHAESESIKLLHSYYESIEEIDSAFYYYKLSVTKTSELDSIRNHKELTKFEGEFELAKTQLIDDRVSFVNRILIIGIVIFVSLIIFYLLIRFFLREQEIHSESQDNLKLSNSLENRKKELKLYLDASLSVSEDNEELEKEIYELGESLPLKYNGLVGNLTKKLKASYDNKVWNEFEFRLKRINHTFFDQLSKEFVELTLNEKKLCSFLYLDMATKDIGKLTGQNLSSLDQARTRLRKKLGLTNKSTTIHDFLKSIIDD